MFPIKNYHYRLSLQAQISKASQKYAFKYHKIEMTQEREIKRLKTEHSKTSNRSSTPASAVNPRFISASTKLKIKRHPLNIKPSGNEIILSSEKRRMKYQSIGDLGCLPDELILEVLDYMKDDLQNLVNLSMTSRYFYALITSLDDHFWKSYYLQHNKSLTNNFEWRGNWRKSILNISNDCLSNVDWDFICSDVIYRPYQCSQINYSDSFEYIINEESKLCNDPKHIVHASTYNHPSEIPQDIVSLGRIPRVWENSMDLKSFDESWNNYPFILKRNNNNKEDKGLKEWPVHWDLKYLQNRFGDVLFRQESVDWDLNLYSDYCQDNQDESPLYLFDCRSRAMSQLRKEYDIPSCFQQDLFRVFKECRPDHSWIIIGPKRSGSTFHKDPNMTSAWNAVLTGSKLWIMLPPGLKPPGVMTDSTESEVTTPLGLAEWVLSGFYNDSVILSDTAVSSQDPRLRCLIGVTFAGECIHVPAGWWHTVINLDDSVALTQNFVPLVKLPHVLNFFDQKNDQISGFHTDQLYKSIQSLLAKQPPVSQDEKNEINNVLQKFVEDCKTTEINDEDVGELNLNKSCIKLPVFELFQRLLIDNGYQSELDQALEKMYAMQRKEREPVLKKNAKWEMLINGGDDDQESNETTAPKSFSFGFAFDESDDSDGENEK